MAHADDLGCMWHYVENDPQTNIKLTDFSSQGCVCVCVCMDDLAGDGFSRDGFAVDERWCGRGSSSALIITACGRRVLTEKRAPYTHTHTHASKKYDYSNCSNNCSSSEIHRQMVWHSVCLPLFSVFSSSGRGFCSSPSKQVLFLDTYREKLQWVDFHFNYVH